jgi:Ulp1 family protease
MSYIRNHGGRSFHHHEGFPRQDDYYDCSVFILANLDKFMSGPEEFRGN